MCETQWFLLEQGTEVQDQDTSDGRTERGNPLGASVKIMTRGRTKVANSHEKLLQKDHYRAMIPVVVESTRSRDSLHQETWRRRMKLAPT